MQINGPEGQGNHPTIPLALGPWGPFRPIKDGPLGPSWARDIEKEIRKKSLKLGQLYRDFPINWAILPVQKAVQLGPIVRPFWAQMLIFMRERISL